MMIYLRQTAVRDMAQGRRFYEVQRGEELGEYFSNSIFKDIDSISETPGIHFQIEGYYRALSRKFPFAIYYKLEEQQIIVWRILDCRQAPSKTADQLKPDHS